MKHASTESARRWQAQPAQANDEEQRPPPNRTPGQAEGEDEAARRNRPEEPLRRRRPGQAEGEDPQDEADEVPPRD